MVPPRPAAETTGQYWSRHLSSLLSQSGPDALPYAEDAKWMIRQHLVSLVEAFPTMPPTPSHFTHNDGRGSHLLMAEGTIPIVFRGVVYNIPLVIWLLETYPRSSPSVFLAPTQDMVIKSGHAHVNGSGHVSVPYLRHWVYPSSNLVDLVRSLIHLFGQDPPLYTRRSLNITSQPSGPSPSQSQSPRHRPSSSRISSHETPCDGGGHHPPQSPERRPSDDRAEELRRTSINMIVKTICADANSLTKIQQLEMDSIFAAQAALRQRGEELSGALKAMREEKEGLELQLQLVLMNVDVLENWVKENASKKKGESVDADGVFEPCDPLASQLIECTAADLAVEDTIYSLDKAVQEGTIPFDVYLKSTRSLSREQFFHRATLEKVRAAQVQVQIQNMAARAQYAS